MRKTIVILLALLTVLSSCAVQSTPDSEKEPTQESSVIVQNPYSEQEGDADLSEGNAYVDAVDWDESTRTLTITGNLPTPCNQLRIAAELEDGQLNLNIYSLISPESMCAQVLEPFEAVLVLENFSKDVIIVSINVEIVEF